MNPLTPIVHPNGTSLATLKPGWQAVEEAAYALDAALDGLEFRFRDYYPRGTDAVVEAVRMMEQHRRAAHAILVDAAEVNRVLSEITV